MSFIFPDLNDTKLMPFKIIRSALQDDPALLDSAECPYTAGVKSFLKLVFLKPVSGSVGDAGAGVVPAQNGFDVSEMAPWPEGAEEFDAIDDKIKALLWKLDKIASSVKLEDTSEQIAISKAQAQLYDRLLAMRERAMNQKTMVEFQEIMLGVIERHLPADDRTAVMTDLRTRLGL